MRNFKEPFVVGLGLRCIVFGLYTFDFRLSTEIYKRFGQATKGLWWMPWGKEPMKGAVSGETRRGAANML